MCNVCVERDQCYQYAAERKIAHIALAELRIEHENNVKQHESLFKDNEYTLYSEEQYQRCLEAANRMRNMISSLKKYPLTPELLSDLIKSGDQFEKVLLEVVNEKFNG